MCHIPLEAIASCFKDTFPTLTSSLLHCCGIEERNCDGPYENGGVTPMGEDL